MVRRQHSNPLQHMNEDHAVELLLVARVLSGHPDATAVRADGVDRHGIDLVLETPDGPTTGRVEFAESIPEGELPNGLKVAFVRLVRRARETEGGGHVSPRGG